jgi:hypothetical protein
MTLDELLLEWSYRTQKGYPCLDNPSDIAILKTLLESLKLPTETIISELESEEDKEDEDLNVLGTTGMEDSPVEKSKETEKKAKDYIDSISCPFEKEIMQKVKSIFSRSDIDDTEKQKLVNRVCSFETYPPVKALLKDKGYPESEFSKFAKEIQNLTEDIPDTDRQFFLDYIKNSEKQKIFNPKQRGNLFDDIKETGIHPNIINDIVKHTTQDSGKKSVGMGELALAIVFKNVGAAKGAGDLSLNDETFEIKGEGATLGKRPDAVNAINLSNIAKFVEGENNLYMAKENKKTSLYYKDNKVNLNSFADVLADIYKNTKDKEGFKQAFKEDLKNIETTKKELHAEAVDQYYSKIKWDSSENIHKGLALLNAFRYILKEDFKHFLAHDFGAGKSNTGDYVYASGTPEEIVDTLLEAGAKFEKISPANLKPRIGFQSSYREE